MKRQHDCDELAITLGVEEEFFLIDPESRDILADPDEAIFEKCVADSNGHKVVREFLRSQIETNTRVCSSVADARSALRETRSLVVRAAEKFGAGVLATSTHPFARWDTQVVTPGARYRDFAVVYQETLRRFLVGGMHVHAGFGDPDSRVRVMTALRQYLPLLHALSGSSPFNEGRATGFKSCRLNLVGNLPRTGIPNALSSWAEYENLLESYRRVHFIEGANELWWDIRPSHAYPTIEMRICDVCTRLEEAISIVALFACLVRYLVRQDLKNSLSDGPPAEIIAENRWIAQRYGVMAFLGDHYQGRRIDIDDYVAEIVDALSDDARALDCERELQSTIDIVRNGTSADRQFDHFRLRLMEGDSENEAMCSVVDRAVAETREGTGHGAMP